MTTELHFSADWCLSIVGHPKPTFVGACAKVPPRTALVLGRKRRCFGHGAFDQAAIASVHAVVDAGDDGAIAIHSVLDTHPIGVNGETTHSSRLRPDDVVEIGNVLLRLHRQPADFVPRSHARIVGTGPAHARLVAELTRAVEHTGPVLLCGEAGTGRRLAARAIHEARGHTTELVETDCRALNVASFVEARGGSVLVTGLASLSSAAQRETVAAACRTAEEFGADLMLSATRPLKLPIFESSLCVVHVPTLRERTEDIPVLAAHLLRHHTGDERPLHRSATMALLRHAWPGNVAELDSVLRSSVAAAGTATSIRLTAPLEAAWPVEVPRAQTKALPAPVAVGPTWFQPDGHVPVCLEGRRALCRVYRSLFAMRVEQPGAPVGVAQLLANGWPGERVLARAGANRVYVALSTLRNLGLRGAISRTRQGYLLDPAATSVAVNAGAA